MTPTNPDEARELEIFKAQLQQELENHKAALNAAAQTNQQQMDSALEKYRTDSKVYIDRRKAMFDGQMSFAVFTLRSAFFANGGGALALLAFLAHVIGEKALTPAHSVDLVREPMALFAWGAFAAVAAAGLAYFSQALFIEHTKPDGASVMWSGNALRVLAVLVAVASLGCFVAGLYSASDHFSKGQVLVGTSSAGEAAPIPSK